eukprot:COSAG03_NODE_11523_length_588_cov_1.137014_2_plen_64_part_01
MSRWVHFSLTDSLETRRIFVQSSRHRDSLVPHSLGLLTNLIMIMIMMITIIMTMIMIRDNSNGT